MTQSITGLKHSVDRAKILSRTGKSCAALLLDVATFHDELINSLFKLCPSTLDSAASGTPIENFANNVNRCVMSYANQTQGLGARIRNDVSRPLLDSNIKLSETVSKIYSHYVASRGKCAQARKEAVKMRQKYIGAVKDANLAIQALRRAKRLKETKRTNDVQEEMPLKVRPATISGGNSNMDWEDALRSFGIKYGLTKNCEAIILALEEIQTVETQYCTLVDSENAAVADAQAIERKVLDAIQKLEEVSRFQVLVVLKSKDSLSHMLNVCYLF